MDKVDRVDEVDDGNMFWARAPAVHSVHIVHSVHKRLEFPLPIQILQQRIEPHDGLGVFKLVFLQALAHGVEG